MSSVGMLGIVSITEELGMLGMLGIARYALFRTTSSAVRDRQ
jgi:hypothetical protein